MLSTPQTREPSRETKANRTFRPFLSRAFQRQRSASDEANSMAAGAHWQAPREGSLTTLFGMQLRSARSTSSSQACPVPVLYFLRPFLGDFSKQSLFGAGVVSGSCRQFRLRRPTVARWPSLNICVPRMFTDASRQRGAHRGESRAEITMPMPACGSCCPVPLRRPFVSVFFCCSDSRLHYSPVSPSRLFARQLYRPN